jgi:tRNA(fMet)-specific endonuclease VapC
MALQALLDTNICIYIARNRPPAVAERFARVTPGSLGISLVTWGELCFGAAKSNDSERAHARLARFVEDVPVLIPGADTGRHYGEIRASLERAGTPIGNNDLWIAAHARALGITLVSNNTREFERVPGLRLENWA